MKDRDFNVLLTLFNPVRLTEPIPQNKSLNIIAWLIAKALCVEDEVKSDDEANRIYNKIYESVKRYGVNSNSIKQRYLSLINSMPDDIPKKLKENNQYIEMKDVDFVLLSKLIKEHKNPKGEDLKKRLKVYEKIALSAIKQMYKSDIDVPDDIIHVTCSGYLSPSPIETFASNNRWIDTTITHSYHMGCYGSIPAIRIGHGFLTSSHFLLNNPKSRIDIVHTELLSLHPDISNDRSKNIVISTLFGDGFIKYSLIPYNSTTKYVKGFKVLAIKENLLPESLDSMTWIPGAHYFDMTLSIRVPAIIRSCVESFVTELLKMKNIDFLKEKNNIIFAIHPGGPKIIDYIKKELGLTDKQIILSNKILLENGNMSSATIPYMLNEILNDDGIPSGTQVVSLGFGPGLTAAGMLLEKIEKV